MRKKLTWLTTTLVFTAFLALTPAVRAETQPKPQEKTETAETEYLNLNTATTEQLQWLPGVGPSKATAILALREKIKGFKRVEDILRVRGIGRKTFKHLRPWLRVEGTTTLKGKIASSHTRAAQAPASSHTRAAQAPASSHTRAAQAPASSPPKTAKAAPAPK